MHRLPHTREKLLPVVIKLNREELEYETGNYAFVERDVAEGQDVHATHQVSDIWDEGNASLMNRVLCLAHEEILELLYPYTKRPICNPLDEEGNIMPVEIGNEPENPDVYTVEMEVPPEMSETTLKYLRTLIHQYMAYRVMREWMSVSNLPNPNSKANYDEKIEEVKAKLRNAVKWRRKPYRICQQPF